MFYKVMITKLLGYNSSSLVSEKSRLIIIQFRNQNLIFFIQIKINIYNFQNLFASIMFFVL